MDGKLFDDSKKKRKKREYPPDPIWDCVVKIWYPSGVPRLLRKKVNAAVSDLKRLGATPESLRAKVTQYRKAWPKMACTPLSIVAHWDGLKGERPPKPTLTLGADWENQSPEVRRQYEAWKNWKP